MTMTTLYVKLKNQALMKSSQRPQMFKRWISMLTSLKDQCLRNSQIGTQLETDPTWAMQCFVTLKAPCCGSKKALVSMKLSLLIYSQLKTRMLA